MKVVLDTHVVIHAANDELEPARKRVVEDPAAHLFVSAVTLWEITKLVELDRLSMPEGCDDFMRKLCCHPRYSIAQYDAELMIELLALAPKLPGDPADQIIVATARCLGASLMTDDRRIRKSRLVEVL